MSRFGFGRGSVEVGRVRKLGAASLALLAAAAVPIASGRAGSSPALVGNPAAGKAVFASWCAQCHTLKAAAAVGAIGPNLDRLKPALSEATIIKAVSYGGSTVMTKAQLAKYSTQMVGYKGSLTSTQINDVSAFVFTSAGEGQIAPTTGCVGRADTGPAVQPVRCGYNPRPWLESASSSLFPNGPSLVRRSLGACASRA